MHRFRICSLVLFAFAMAVPCQAGKVKVWHHSTQADFDDAELRGAVVTSEGELELGRRLTTFADLDVVHIWDVIEDQAGNVYVATGPRGQVWKVPPQGKANVVHQDEDSQVLCLALAPDGSVLAGTGPGGRIVRIDARGQVQVLSVTGENYVWSLAVDPAGVVYAATGPHGKVLRVGNDGKTEVFYDTHQGHVLCLKLGADGMIYAGTDTRGLIYRIDAQGKGFVLFQAAQPEVRRLLVFPEAIYALTSAPTIKAGSSTAKGDTKTSVTTVHKVSDIQPAVSPPPTRLADNKTPSSDETKVETKGNKASAPSTPSSGENSIYRIGYDGTAREVFRTKGMLLSFQRHGNSLRAGTDSPGKLFEIDLDSRTHTELARFDHAQVLSMWTRQDGSLLVGTGDPARLYLLQDNHAERGVATSEVLDAKMVSRWGALRWQADVPQGASVSVAVRTGNVEDPDSTWSAWSAEQADGQSARIVAPAARFLQYRVKLVAAEGGRQTPSVRGIALSYANVNQAPELTRVEVPDLNVVHLDDPKKYKVKWSAVDANEDELTYTLSVRKEGWSDWVELEQAYGKTEYEWDTTTTPSGVYRLKVVASDRLANSEPDALTHTKVSVPFVVSHTPPAVSLKVLSQKEGRATIEVAASSPWVRLVKASYAINGKKWVPLFPEDGMFDGTTEKFQFETDSLEQGAYVLVVQTRDAAGNTGSADLVFKVEGK